MKRYIIDTSYISNMLQYYEMSDSRFSFIWDSLLTKVKTEEIILCSKVIKELDNFLTKGANNLKDFLDNLKDVKPKEENQFYIREVVKTYEKNKSKFKGSFERFAIETSADLSLIAIALEYKEIGDECFILTDEIMPSIPDNSNKIKLNIPSLAKLLEIECIKSEKGITIFLN